MTPASKWRRPLCLLLASASLPVAAGCGGGDGSSSGGSAPGAAKSAVKLEMSGFAFTPATVTVATGGTVTWTDEDSAPHTATADDQKSFDTGTVDQGKSKTVTFSKAGTYTYFCRFHPFMHGTVIVR